MISMDDKYRSRGEDWWTRPRGRDRPRGNNKHTNHSRLAKRVEIHVLY
jgi:hypothetical protein